MFGSFSRRMEKVDWRSAREEKSSVISEWVRIGCQWKLGRTALYAISVIN